ncbi:MAG: hypothetical protein SFW35_00450 [Chitinophagales bacterium]|nr:hypothetical protein [Chitinophagales bacterium]
MSLENGKMPNKAGYSETPLNQQGQVNGDLLLPQHGEDRPHIVARWWNKMRKLF